MSLSLCNSYPATLWASIMFYSPETCGGDGRDFEMMGWWRVEPGACARVYANDLADLNRYWYYYAHSADGAVWAGPYGASVRRSAFGGSQACYGTQSVGSGGELDEQISFRELDVGDHDDYTLTFVS